MQKTKLLLGIIIAFTVAFIGLRVFKQDTVADFVRPIILPLVTVLYCIKTKKRRGYFFYFLFLYSIAELIGISYFYLPLTVLTDNLLYFGCNLLYIAAYIFLILDVLRLVNIREMLNRFPIHIIILLALDIYSVILVSDIAYKSENLVSIYDLLLEILYNTVIMVLLTIALINYLNKDTKKAMNLLFGSICIVFSEVIQVAYFYVSEIYILNIAYCVLLVIAFFLFYIQHDMVHAEEKVYNPLEKQLEA